MQEQEQVDQFDVAAETGETFTVCVYREVVDAGHIRDPGKKIYGDLFKYRATEGWAVSALEDGTFEILHPVRPIITRKVEA